MFGLLCGKCGVRLEAESHVGPPRVWFASCAQLEVEAKLLGWVDGKCPTCKGADDVR